LISVQPRERITQAFKHAKDASRGALIPYLVAGDPDADTTDAVIAAISAAGADIIELGIPYSDPIADGPTIAAAAKRSLDAGTTIDTALAIAARAHEGGSAPILFFTYLNPILQYGLERFAQRACDVGACGVIVPDVPLEESDDLHGVFGESGLAFPQLVAPTTPIDRAARIAQASDGFLYLVSRMGVTGAGDGVKREPDIEWIGRRVRQLRACTEQPIAVGFGIATPAHVRAVIEHADGVIIGSALLDTIARLRGTVAAQAAAQYIVTLSSATTWKGRRS
jgi:tryptophan synthase alpha chain